jgi:WD40 repeat protein
MFTNRDILKLCLIHYRWPRRQDLWNSLKNRILLNAMLNVEKDITNKLCLKGHDDYITTLLCLSDNSIVSGSWDKTIRVWAKNRKYKCIKILFGHKNGVLSLALLSNGDIASGSADYCIKIWHNFICISTIALEEKNPITRLVLHPNGNLISTSITIRIWDPSFKCLKVLNTPDKTLIRDILVSKDGNIISADSNFIRIYRAKDDYLNEKVLDEHQGEIIAIKELKNSNIVSAATDICIKIWDIRDDFRCIQTIVGYRFLYSMVLLSNGHIILGEKFIRNLDKDKGYECTKVLYKNRSEDCLVFLLDNKDLIITEFNTIKLWGL